MKCGHHQSLSINSAETGAYLYCDLCDAKGGRASAVREQYLIPTPPKDE